MNNHLHDQNCGCQDYIMVDDSQDLRSAVFMEGLVCLNEKIKDSGKNVFKHLSNKFDKSLSVQSDVDSELLFIIPFDSNVNILKICVIAQDSNNYPDKLSLYVNLNNIDFSSIQDQTVTQEFDIGPNLDGSMQIALKVSKFTNVSTLILHFSSETEEFIQISYIGLYGVNTKMKQQIVNTVYETQPNMADHKTQDIFNQHTLQ